MPCRRDLRKSASNGVALPGGRPWSTRARRMLPNGSRTWSSGRASLSTGIILCIGGSVRVNLYQIFRAAVRRSFDRQDDAEGLYGGDAFLPWPRIAQLDCVAALRYRYERERLTA